MSSPGTLSTGTTSSTSSSAVLYALPETTIFQSVDGKTSISITNKSLEESGSQFPAAEPYEDQPNFRKPVVLPEPSEVLLLLLQFFYSPKPDLSRLSVPEVTQLYLASKKYNVLAAIEVSTKAILDHPEELLAAALREYSQSTHNSNLDLFAHMCVSLPLGNTLRAIPVEYHCAWINFFDAWNELWKSALDETRTFHAPDSSCSFAKSLGDYAYNLIKDKPPPAGLWSRKVPFPFGMFASGLGPDMYLPECCGTGFHLWVKAAERRASEIPLFSQVLVMKPVFGYPKFNPSLNVLTTQASLS
ncbi:hypothetical protein BJ165DRAFT_1484458 [Panaeolus papilionaceus]|nr:hypothetical protein BJ165DRAFT_1484458 [Panaeolus papilionaceus]